MPPTCVDGRQDHRGDDRLLDLLDAPASGSLAGLSISCTAPSVVVTR
jgi:hypothetical protein